MGAGSSAGTNGGTTRQEQDDDSDEESELQIPPKKFRVKENVQGQGTESAKLFKKLCISDHAINKIYSIFCAIDVDRSHTIDLEEFFSFFKLEPNELSRRAFSIFDEDGNGTIDFREFVASLWNYCSMDVSRITTFTFKLFDLDNSRSLDAEEVKYLIDEGMPY